MKKFIAFLLALVVLHGISPFTYAAQDDNMIYYSDGSYITIELSEGFTQRSSGSKNYQKTYVYRDSANNIGWEAILYGSFTYNGTSATCTSASCTITIYNSVFYEVSKDISRSGNTASAEFTIGRKYWLVTIGQKTYNIRMSCDKNGNIT